MLRTTLPCVSNHPSLLEYESHLEPLDIATIFYAIMFRSLSIINRHLRGHTNRINSWVKFLVDRRICTSRMLEQREADSRKQPVKLNFEIQKVISLYNHSSANVELSDIKICLEGKEIIFNLTWLRDSCHCFKCTHQYSRQRLFTANNFRKDMFTVNDIQFSLERQVEGQVFSRTFENKESVYLNVIWADGHKSSYPLDWLRYTHGLYVINKLQLNNHLKPKIDFKFPEDDFYLPTNNINTKPIYWNASEISTQLQPINYHDLVDNFKFNDDTTFINANRVDEMSQRRFAAMRSLSNQLVSYGLAKLVNVPQERNQVLKVARSLAYERPTGYGTVFDVVVEPSEEINLAYSSLEFDLHSDLTYREISPGVQLLHCIRNSIQGGLSYFSDAHQAARTLKQSDPELYGVLIQFPVTFVVRDPYRNIKFRKQKPVLSVDYQGNLSDIYYSPFMLPPTGHREDVKLFYLAFDKFTQILQSNENKLIAKMDPGDLFIFHNRRVLHGRSAYDSTNSKRFLQGCYMDWDEIECLHEKLNSYKNTDGDSR